MAPPKARFQGRKKVEMKLIPDSRPRKVTFCKRQAGLFRKATELSILCGVQIALVIFSPRGQAYSFGHPNVESVIDRFFNTSWRPGHQDSERYARIHSSKVQRLKEQCDEKCQEVQIASRRRKEIEAALESSPFAVTEERLDELDLHQLTELKQMLEKLRKNVHDLVSSSQTGSVESPRSDAAGPSDSKKAVQADADLQKDVAEPSNTEKAFQAPLGRNGPPLAVGLGLEKVDLVKSADLRLKMVVEGNERDTSPIWILLLSLQIG